MSEQKTDRIRDQFHYHANQMRALTDIAGDLLTITKSVQETNPSLSDLLADIGTEICDIAEGHQTKAREAMSELQEYSGTLREDINETKRDIMNLEERLYLVEPPLTNDDEG